MTHTKRLSATRAYEELKSAQKKVPANVLIPCEIALERFQDLPQMQPVDQEHARNQCGDCPLLKPCYNYGRANKGALDIWGGNDWGREARFRNRMED